jgi:hypothetical protein
LFTQLPELHIEVEVHEAPSPPGATHLLEATSQISAGLQSLPVVHDVLQAPVVVLHW